MRLCNMVFLVYPPRFSAVFKTSPYNDNYYDNLKKYPAKIVKIYIIFKNHALNIFFINIKECISLYF